MPLPDQVLISRVAAALAGADAEQSFTVALNTLGACGFVPHSAAAGEPWLQVEGGGRSVALAVAAEPADTTLRETLRHLLGAGLKRIADQDELVRARERLEMLSSASFEGILVHVEGVVIDANQRLAELLGYEPSEVLGGQTVQRCVAPEDVPSVLERMREGYEGAYLITGVRKDGSRFRAELQSKQGKLGEKPVRVVAVRDVSERERTQSMLRETEQQLQRSRHLESLGVLAGGVAHDFNNLLVGVLGNAELLQCALTQPGDRELCEGIITAAERAAALTSQLLAYAGQPELTRRQTLDLGELWRDLDPTARARLRDNVQLKVELGPDSVVVADRTSVSQVLMNLVTNASEAFGAAGGTIELCTRRLREPDERWDNALGACVGTGDWVQIEVRDTGVGMDQPTLRRLFEPFFSTKNKGHGLGLASCLGIVSSHGGALAVDSEPGRGSRFSVLLPASPRVPSAAPHPPASVGQPCRVLVIDDESVVRSLLRRSLERRGYSVTEAADGHTGIREIEERTPDLVVLDMTMPDLDGAEVLRRVRDDGFTMPILIASGHVDAAMESRLSRGSFQGLLRKPFSVAELVAAIEAARVNRLQNDS